VTIGLALIVAALAIFQIGRRSFWQDEVVSARSATEWQTYLGNFGHDTFNLLYYTLLRAWAVLGNDETALRGFSAVCAVLGVVVFHRIARELFGSGAALAATLMLCVSPFFIHYAQEARTYALAFLLVTTSMFVFLRALERPGLRWRAAYVLIAVLSLYAHFFAGYLVAAQLIYLVYQRRLDRWWIFAFMAIAVGIAPLLWFAFFGLSGLTWIPRTSPGVLFRTFTALAGGSDRPSEMVGLDRAPALLALGLYAALGLFALVGLVRDSTGREEDPRQLVVLWLASSIVGPIVVSLWKPDLVARYFIVALPPILMLAGAGLARIAPWRLRSAILATLVLLGIWGLSIRYTAPFDDWRSTARFVVSTATVDDGILLRPKGGAGPFIFYAHQASREPPVGVPLPGHATRILVSQTLASEGRRLWIAIGDADVSELADVAAFEQAVQTQGYVRIDERSFGTVHVGLWTMPSD
jgi:4-amino-4-deoxy-L-arabinose transferase-like glycosyltransferase